MNDWLNNTWVIRIISLVLAVLTFIIISFDNQNNRSADVGFDSFFSSSQETQTLENIPVNILIDDENYVVSGVPQTVSVTLEGTVSVVQSTATQRNFDVFVDLEDLEPGTYRVPLEYEGISNRLDVSIEPAEIEVSIEERATSEFDVLVDYTNVDGLQDGFELLEANVYPPTVQITSSKSMVERISIVKAFVDVDGVGESMEIQDVPVRVYDNEGNQLNVRIEPETVDVGINVDNPSKTVPIEIQTTGNLSSELQLITIEPDIEDVQIFASEADLADIDEIYTTPINLADVKEDTSFEVELDLPDTVRLASEQSVTVFIAVEERIEATFENVEIELENLMPDYSATFLNPVDGQIDINVTGYESEIDEIDTSAIRLSIDLGDLEEGEHQVPIEVYGLNDLDYNLAIEDAIVRIE